MNCVQTVARRITFETHKPIPLHRVTFLFFILLSALATVAQKITSLYFTQYGIKEGVASNEVFAVQQDRTGFLWLATNNGLQRFDGVKFKTFRHEDGNAATIPSNVIFRLFIDRDDVLWVADQNAQFGWFDKSRFAFHPVPVRSKVAIGLLGSETSFTQDRDGHLFVIHHGHQPLLYNRAKGEFGPVQSMIPLPQDWGITSLTQEPATGKYWLGRQSGGLIIYNPKTKHLNYSGHNPDGEPAVDLFGPDMGFTYGLFDNNGRFWFQHWGPGFPYLVLYDPRQPTKLRQFEFITRLKQYHELRSIIQLRDGRIWIRGLKLLGYFDEKKDDFVLLPDVAANIGTVKFEEIYSMMEDRENNLWLSTNNNGLFRFSPSRQVFTNVEHASRSKPGEAGSGAVMSFASLRSGNLLSGTWEDCLFQYTPELKQVPLPATWPGAFRNAYIWSMFSSADSNTIWMGAQPGFWQFDQQQQTVTFHNPPALKNRTVRQIVEDRTGALWLGIHGSGVFRCPSPKGPKKDSVTFLSALGSQMINKLMVDRKGLVWVGTGGGGVYVYEAATARLLHHFDGGINGSDTLPAASICGLLDYNDSLVFVADNSRLYSYNRNTGKLRYRSIAGALSGNVSALEKDQQGHIWISTTNALYRVHPASRAALVFNRLDGIFNDRFILSASGQLRDGRMLFGTTNSFVVFNPVKAGELTPPPRIMVTGIQVGQRELPADSVMKLERLEFPSKNNSLTIDFAPLVYDWTYPIQYKMEGIDQDWRFADMDSRVSYPFLPVGQHSFLLRAYSPGSADVPITRLQIRMTPPWYQTWWFYTLVAVCFVVELWWLDRQRSRRKEVLQKVRTDIATGLHEEVNTALNNINILSEIARLKSDRDPQRAKEYLEQIHTKSHNMIIAMDDMLWSLNPENDAMNKTIVRIREFADSLMQRHGVVIELLIDKRVEKMELNMKLRHDAFLLFKEGVRSLVEAGTRLCVVHVTAERSRLLFTIEFENEGCNMQQLNNLLHRRDMELRLETLKAKLDVQVHKSRSVFLLQLPLV